MVRTKHFNKLEHSGVPEASQMNSHDSHACHCATQPLRDIFAQGPCPNLVIRGGRHQLGNLKSSIMDSHGYARHKTYMIDNFRVSITPSHQFIHCRSEAWESREEDLHHPRIIVLTCKETSHGYVHPAFDMFMVGIAGVTASLECTFLARAGHSEGRCIHPYMEVIDGQCKKRSSVSVQGHLDQSNTPLEYLANQAT